MEKNTEVTLRSISCSEHIYLVSSKEQKYICNFSVISYFSMFSVIFTYEENIKQNTIPKWRWRATSRRAFREFKFTLFVIKNEKKKKKEKKEIWKHIVNGAENYNRSFPNVDFIPLLLTNHDWLCRIPSKVAKKIRSVWRKGTGFPIHTLWPSWTTSLRSPRYFFTPRPCVWRMLERAASTAPKFILSIE